MALFVLAKPVRAQQNITTLAGGPLPAGVNPTAVGLLNPTAIARDQNGNLLILDCSRLYRLQNTQLIQIAGNGAGCQPGFPADPGDGRPALNAAINAGFGLGADSSGDIFFTDFGSNEVRELSASTGEVVAVPGSAAAGLNQPWGLAVDATGNLYVADQGNNRVVEITASGAVTTLAAIADPGSLSLDGNRNLYVAQFQTASTSVYKVVLSTGATTVIAGGGTTTLAAGVTATAAQIPEVTAVYADAAGDVYLAAGSNGALNTVYEIPAGSTTLQIPAGGALNPNQQINAIAADPAGGLDLASAGAGGPVQQLASGTLTTLAGGAARGGYLDLAQPLTSIIAPAHLDASAGLVVSDGSFHSADLLSLANGTFSVVGAGLNGGGPVVRDAAGNLIAAGTFFNGTSDTVVSINPPTGQSTTLAGTGTYGYTGDGGPATSAEFKSISALALDAQGDVFIADSSASVVREVNAKTGIITTVAGNGTQGESGDGGLATAAELNHPDAIAVDGVGNLFIADVDTGFNTSVAFDGYHPPVADGVIRRVDAQTGVITTIAGTPDDANGNPPNLALGAGDGGPATSAGLSLPEGLAVDLAGNLYVADYGDAKVREVTAYNGGIVTIAGNGKGGAAGDGGPARSAELRPCGVSLDPQGNLYIADCDAGRVREVADATGAPQASPSSLDFGAQTVNVTTSAQAITLTNPGLAPVTIFAVAATGDFAETNNCATLAAGATCTVNVIFTPTAAGPRTGTLSVTSTSTAAAQTIALAGSGAVPAAALNAASLTFAAQPTSTTSAAQTVTLTNSGAAALAISSIAASGDFAQTNTCGASLAAGGNCAIAVTFTPTATGSRTGALTITDNAAGSPQTAALSGTGLAPAPAAALSAASLTFGTQFLSYASNAKGITLFNGGSAPLTIASITVSGDFTEQNQCAPTLAAGGSCDIEVSFTPTTVGNRTGTLAITDNAADSPQTASLSGTGANLTIAPASGSSTSATVTAGQTAVYNLVFTPVDGASGTFGFGCAGSPPGAACEPSPDYITLSGAPIPVTVTVPTTAASAVPALPPSDNIPWLPLAAAALLLLAVALRRRRRPLLPLATAILLASAIACGGGSGSNSNTITTLPATPRGAYTLNLLVMSGRITLTETLTLTVN